MESRAAHSIAVTAGYGGDASQTLVTAEQVGDILLLKPRTVPAKSARDPDFPQPIKIGATDKGAKHAPSRWLLSEVLAYLERLKAARDEQATCKASLMPISAPRARRNSKARSIAGPSGHQEQSAGEPIASDGEQQPQVSKAA